MTTISDTVTLDKSKLEISPFEKIVHDFVSPVHGILNLSDSLYNDWDKIPDVIKKEALKDLYQSAEKLNKLVKEMRNLKRT